MKYVIIGGAGFIGSHFLDSLLEEDSKAKVVVIDNFFLGKEENIKAALNKHETRVTIYKEDAANIFSMLNIINKEKPDIIFNFATKALLYSFENPAEAMKVNVDIIINLLESLRFKQYSRLIHISTSEVFGSAVTPQMDENHPLLPETTYAAGKSAADLTINSYVNMFDLDVITLRPFNNYGPRQNTGALAAIIPLTITRILNGLPPILEGDGLQTRDFIYVKDTIKIITKFITFSPQEFRVFNIGSGQETSMISLVTLICDIMSYSGDVLLHEQRRADVRRHSANITRLINAIGPIAFTQFQEGIKNTINWYKDRIISA